MIDAKSAGGYWQNCEVEALWVPGAVFDSVSGMVLGVMLNALLNAIFSAVLSTWAPTPSSLRAAALAGQPMTDAGGQYPQQQQRAEHGKGLALERRDGAPRRKAAVYAKTIVG